MALLPQAVPAEGGRLINGAEVRLVWLDVELAGQVYRADYYFQEDAFLQVSLKTPDGLPRDNDEVRRGFAHLAGVLTKMLGAPDRNRPVVQDLFSLNGGMEWDLPGNDKAWLAIVPVNRRTAHLTFGYRPDNDWVLKHQGPLRRAWGS